MAAVSFLVVLAVSFALSSAAPLTTSTTTTSTYGMFPTDICGSIAPGSRIVGGAPINSTYVQYQAQICVNAGGAYAFNCGGTLITQSCVLSAAHCFLYSTNPSDYMINLGKQYSDQTVQECNAAAYYIDSFVTHQQFSSTLLTNDIALVFIKSKVSVRCMFCSRCSIKIVFHSSIISQCSSRTTFCQLAFHFPIRAPLPRLVRRLRSHRPTTRWARRAR
jgi:secreted trypsin-like serine protease